MIKETFCFVSGESASDPDTLPFEATSPDGRIFSDLANQYSAGYLSLADLASFGYWPATVEYVDIDPEIEISTGIEKTLSPATRTVLCRYTKRDLTDQELTDRHEAANPIPDNPTLGDWRVAMVLWGRLPEILGRIKVLVESGHPLGAVVQERVEYSNNVLRSELMTLREGLGFSEEDVIESLWRADRVRQGDLSGVWPLVPATPEPVAEESAPSSEPN